MEKKNLIRRFNLFSIQNNSSNDVQVYIQHLLYYAESRFSYILNLLRVADDDRIPWCQKLLHRELVNDLYIFIYITVCQLIKLLAFCIIIHRNINLYWTNGKSADSGPILGREYG